MSLEGKKMVSKFYESDFYNNPEVLKEYLHEDAELFWNSSTGFHKMGFEDIKNLVMEMSKSIHALRAEISHILSEKNLVSIRFTYYARTIENPNEELPIAHFMALWELKDKKMFKGHQMSQPADDTPENLSSFVGNNF